MTQTIIKIPAQSSFDPTDITIADNTSGAFLVQDSSYEYIKINTTTNSERVVTGIASQNAAAYHQTKLGNSTGVLIQGNFQHIHYINQGSNGFWKVKDLSNRDRFAVTGLASGDANNRISFMPTGQFKIVDTASSDILNINDDSTFTYTFDDGSGATFTIKDDQTTTDSEGNVTSTPRLHLRCTESAASKPQVEVNGLQVFSGGQLTLTSATYGTHFVGGIMQARSAVALGATTATRLIDLGVVNMENYAQILTATPSTTSQVFTLDFNDTGTALSNLPVALYKFVLKNAGSQSCTFTAGSTMAGGGRGKGVDISGQSIGVLDSSSGTITAAAGETIYVEITSHVSDSAGTNANRFIICKTICKI